MAGQFNPPAEDCLEYEIRIKVIGVGGGGSLVVESMMGDGMKARDRSCVELICADTDADALKIRCAHKVIRLGRDAWGAARTLEEGRGAAEAAAQEIRAALTGAHMLFILVVLGGSTGTGAAPVIARLAREMGLLTVVGAVTQPFDWNNSRGMSAADASLAELEEYADAVIVMRYATLLEVLGGGVTPDTVLAYVYVSLKNLVRDMAAMLHPQSLVGVDLEDVRTVLGESGPAMMGTAYARGADRGRIAAEQALISPPLANLNLAEAQGVLVFISGANGSFKLSETKTAMNTVRAGLTPESHVIFGTSYDDALGDDIRVTVIAAGLSDTGDPHRLPPP